MESLDRSELIAEQEQLLNTLRTSETLNSLKNTMCKNIDSIRTFAPIKQVGDVIVLTDGKVNLILGKSTFKVFKGDTIPTIDIKLNLATKEIRIVEHKWYL